jgi:16S rRNA (guanine(966)-N(2))-methyltransferase RsmD
MRIISGKYKGKRLIAPKNLPVRPTTDFAKEALFNILNNQVHFETLSMLDLFAGTGNISFEFASRGTTNITAVDSHFGCVRYINKIKEELQFSITTFKSDVYKFLERQQTPFDLVFADPPYSFSEEAFLKIADLVFANSLLNPDGILIIEHAKHTDLSKSKYYIESRRYGGSVFSFFKIKN